MCGWDGGKEDHHVSFEIPPVDGLEMGNDIKEVFKVFGLKNWVVIGMPLSFFFFWDENDQREEDLGAGSGILECLLDIQTEMLLAHGHTAVKLLSEMSILFYPSYSECTRYFISLYSFNNDVKENPLPTTIFFFLNNTFQVLHGILHGIFVLISVHRYEWQQPSLPWAEMNLLQGHWTAQQEGWTIRLGQEAGSKQHLPLLNDLHRMRLLGYSTHPSSQPLSHFHTSPSPPFHGGCK